MAYKLIKNGAAAIFGLGMMVTAASADELPIMETYVPTMTVQALAGTDRLSPYVLAGTDRLSPLLTSVMFRGTDRI